MENIGPQDIVLQLVWPPDGTPPVAANQHLVQIAQDADGGPGEMIVTMGYVVPPNLSPDQAAELQRSGQALHVTPVSRFMVSRHQAEALVGTLQDMIANWDQINLQARGGRSDE